MRSESPAEPDHHPATPPEVSIITTTLNCEQFLGESIESVLSQQTDIDWELLLIDDGSEDRSCRIARHYASGYPDRIFFHQHPAGRFPRPRNRGISASRNLGLRHARGTLTAFLDADDVLLPHKLQRQVETMRAHPEVAMTYASAERWFDYASLSGQSADPLGRTPRNFVPPLVPKGQRDGVVAPPTVLEWYLADETLAPCACTVIVRTDAARSVGGFVDSFTGLFDDQVFYAKLALGEKILVDSACVAKYRQHPQSCCALIDSREGMNQRRTFLAWLERYTVSRGVSYPRLREILAVESAEAASAAAELLERKLDESGGTDRENAAACVSGSAAFSR